MARQHPGVEERDRAGGDYNPRADAAAHGRLGVGVRGGAPALGTAFGSQSAQYPATQTLEQSEHNLILRTLKLVNWKIEGPGGAAELLDIHPSTLRTRMKKMGIAKP
jgi:transcriptional regulator of acetoin/glycerol metabolism